MKINKVLLLSLAMVIVILSAVGCQSQPKQELKVTVSVLVDGVELLPPYSITEEATADRVPTVLQTVQDALILNDILFSADDDNLSIESIGEYENKIQDEYTYFWSCSINGTVPEKDRAGNIEIHDGDQIVYTYTKALTADLLSDL